MADTLVWITGASSGIGAALATNVPFDDAHVVDISRSGGTSGTEHLPADLSDPDAWAAVGAHLLAQLARTRARRAVFVHNAGTLAPIGYAGEVDPVAYRRQILLDAAAPLALGNAFLTAVAESLFEGESDLVQITSGAAATPYPGWSGYCAAKAAVDMWVRTVGREQASRPRGTRVIAVAPGVVDTPMQAAIRASDAAHFPAVERFRELHASGSLRTPEAVARELWALLDRDLDNGAVVDLRAGA